MKEYSKVYIKTPSRFWEISKKSWGYFIAALCTENASTAIM